MSATRLVRSDDDGVFVRTGGYVFRPRPPGGYAPRRSLRYREGDRVPARHVPGTTTARVGAEIWSSA